MIAVDTNVLVHAHRADSPFNETAFAAMRSLVEGLAAWTIPWPCLHEFAAIVTHPRIWRPPSTLAQMEAQVEVWLESASLTIIGEAPTHWSALRGLLRAGKVLGGTVHDARIAAICIEHGVDVLWSADRDFSRFPALTTKNPLPSAE